MDGIFGHISRQFLFYFSRLLESPAENKLSKTVNIPAERYEITELTGQRESQRYAGSRKYLSDVSPQYELG
jgi:hypothetical protein